MEYRQAQVRDNEQINWWVSARYAFPKKWVGIKGPIGRRREPVESECPEHLHASKSHYPRTFTLTYVSNM